MVEIPIYNDSEDRLICETCRAPIPPGESVIPCIDKRVNVPINTCKTCFDANPNYVRIDECMPSGDVVM